MTDDKIKAINIGVLCGIIWGNIIITGMVYILNRYMDIN